MRQIYRTKSFPEYAPGPAHWGIVNSFEPKSMEREPYPQTPIKPVREEVIDANNKRYWSEFGELSFELSSLEQDEMEF